MIFSNIVKAYETNRMSLLNKLLNFKILIILLILVLTAIPYITLPTSGFVDFDDPILVHENPAVINFDLEKIFLKSNAEDYLPMTTITFAIEHSIFGFDPFYFHLDNIILHLFNVTLVFLFITLLFPNSILIAALTALLFGIHPLHVESVAWISQRKDVLSTFFFISSLIFYIYSGNKIKKYSNFIFYVLSIIFFILAILSKFMAVSLPGIIILLDLLKKEKRQKILFRSLPFVVVMTIFSVIHLKLHNSIGQDSFEKFNLLAGIKNGFDSLAFYISKSIIPLKLSAFYEKNVVFATWIDYSFLLSWIGIILLYVKAKKEVAMVVFVNIFFLATIFPVLQIIPFGKRFIFADRFMYLPSIGLFCFIAMIIIHLSHFKTLRWFTYSAVVVIIVSFSYLTYNQALAWKNSETLWSHAFKNYPISSSISTSLASEYFKKGNVKDASIKFQQAINFDPNFDDPRIGLAAIYMDSQNFEEAKKELKIAQSISSKNPMTYFNLGVIAEKQNDLITALENYKKSVQFDDLFTSGYLNISAVYYKLDRKKDAQEILEKLIHLNPNVPEANNNLGYIYFEMGRYPEAIKFLNQAISLDSTYEQPHRSLALIYFKTGKYDLGVTEINTANIIQKAEKNNPSRKRRN